MAKTIKHYRAFFYRWAAGDHLSTEERHIAREVLAGEMLDPRLVTVAGLPPELASLSIVIVEVDAMKGELKGGNKLSFGAFLCLSYGYKGLGHKA